MPSPPDVGVVIVAAGRGERAGGGLPKQFRLIAGIPMVVWSLRRFLAHQGVADVVVVVPPDVTAGPPVWLNDLGDSRLRLVAGGSERVDSVEAGLAALDGRCKIVLVHDGARPFVRDTTIAAVIAVARAGQGAIAAIPVSDTLKRVVDGRVAGTLDRDTVWRAQTPQGFPIGMLRGALRQFRAGGASPTDDASLVEANGATVVIVPDQITNLKITQPDDFIIAEGIARALR